MTKRFKHDCWNCLFIGTAVHKDVRYDMYVCTHDGCTIDSVVARYGDDGPDYISGLDNIASNNILRAVLDAALMLGFRTKK